MIVLENCRVFDAARPTLREDHHIVVEGARIKEVTDVRPQLSDAERFDLGGRAVIPGLIDAHAHVCLPDYNLTALRAMQPSRMFAEAVRSLENMLARGFTTIRDAAGADRGLADAVDTGVIVGPRIYPSGHALSPTGGHGDQRFRVEEAPLCGCGSALEYAFRTLDGVPEVLQGVRDEIRRGASQVKVMASGGVTSVNDPIDSVQFSPEELSAITEEAARWGKYVMAHVYSPEAIAHAVNCGVRSLEHCNLLDSATADLVAQNDCFVVPTLITYDTMERYRERFGLTAAQIDKLKYVMEAGYSAVELCAQKGIPMGFGTDLLGSEAQERQAEELLLRGEMQSNHEVLKSATAINAELLQADGDIGEIAAGARADILVLEADPLTDLSVLTRPEENLAAIMKDGVFYKNELA